VSASAVAPVNDGGSESVPRPAKNKLVLRPQAGPGHTDDKNNRGWLSRHRFQMRGAFFSAFVALPVADRLDDIRRGYPFHEAAARL